MPWVMQKLAGDGQPEQKYLWIFVCFKKGRKEKEMKHDAKNNRIHYPSPMQHHEYKYNGQPSHLVG
jgi:hypothetical protein